MVAIAKRILAPALLLTTIASVFFVNRQADPPAQLTGKWITKNIQISTSGIQADLTYNGPEKEYKTAGNAVIQNLQFRVQTDDEQELTVYILNNAPRFEVPYREPFPFTKVRNNNERMYTYEYSEENQEFFFRVIRADTKEVIFDTSNQEFFFTQKFIQIATQMDQEYIYGLGERRNTQFLYTTGSYTFLNKDQYMTIDNQQLNHQTYGHHPMYLRREKSGHWHVVFLRNYYGMAVNYIKNKNLQYQIIGGDIELKFFLDGTQQTNTPPFNKHSPEEAIKRYHNYLNGFSLHPFWAQGWHQCRWGYDTSEKLLEAVDKYDEYQLPIDIIWNDIDYMVQFQDFTVNTDNYDTKAMAQRFDLSKDSGVHWIPIIDAGISLIYDGKTRGDELDIWIQSGQTNKPLIGCVWPGKVNYVDFNHPDSIQYWTEGLRNISQNYGITPSGIWIDMNEFSNFHQGEITIDQDCQMPSQFTFLQKLKDTPTLPFNPSGDVPLDEKTLSLDATHFNGPSSLLVNSSESLSIYEWDFHNLNGFGEGFATNQALKQLGSQLPFIISRSTIAGSGKWVQHWTGDNGADYNYLGYSLTEIFNFQLFGIPMTGVDICGFAGDTNPELCAKWMTVGALYPFARNHNDNTSISQEPYAFPGYDYVLQASKKALDLRYSLLKQYYTYFVALNGTGTVFKPLFFEFPDDVSLLAQDQQFMIGPNIMVAPVLKQGDAGTNTTGLTVQFPVNSNWFDRETREKISSGQPGLQRQYTKAFSDSIPMFYREGSIIFRQQPQLRSRLLGNEFYLDVQLTLIKYNPGGLRHYNAYGSIMSISDYNDVNIINKCTRKNNCIINLWLEVIQSQTKIVININAIGQYPDTNLETIIIKGLNLNGLQLSNKQYMEIDLGAGFAVQKQNLFFQTVAFLDTQAQ